MDSSFTALQQRIRSLYPDYAKTAFLDELRKKDYGRLDESGQVYLDFTGGNLYASSQIEKHHQLLLSDVYGNPHSLNPSSLKSSQLVENSRNTILKYFNGLDDYFLVFTPNASGALKIIGESYPFNKHSHFLLPFDNHNSVNGIREYVKSKGGSYSYSPLNYEDLRFDSDNLTRKLKEFKEDEYKLFAYPAQSNVSGVKHSLEWVHIAHEYGWDVLLDASAFVPTNRLDLKKVNPDFVSVSFYKMFGYPTGLGGLFIRKDTFSKLQKPWFAGGTVTLASAMADKYYLAEDHSKFEDGTINYLDIPALKIGIEHIQEIGIDLINQRVGLLTDILIHELMSLKHENDKPMIKVFGPTNNVDRGGTLIFNFLNEHGEVLPYLNVEAEANKKNISIRTGCFCNPGIDEINNHLLTGDLESYFKANESGGVEEMMIQMNKMRGAVRVSVGLITNEKDIHQFLEFVKDFATKK